MVGRRSFLTLLTRAPRSSMNTFRRWFRVCSSLACGRTHNKTSNKETSNKDKRPTHHRVLQTLQVLFGLFPLLVQEPESSQTPVVISHTWYDHVIVMYCCTAPHMSFCSFCSLLWSSAFSLSQSDCSFLTSSCRAWVRLRKHITSACSLSYCIYIIS